MVNEFKTVQLEAIKEKLQSARNMIFVDFFKVNANLLSNIRKELRKNKVNMFVLKTSLAKLAFKQLNAPEQLIEKLNHQNAIIYGDDPIIVSRAAGEFTIKKPILNIKFAYFEGKVCDKSVVETYSNYTSKNDLISVLVHKIKQPIISLVFDLKFVINKLVNILREIEKNKK